MSTVEISVIAPCLNEEGNIESLVSRIAAALEGMAVPFEVVLVDDGSDDQTWRKIQELRDSVAFRVVGVRHGCNKGIVASWTSGLSAASGKIACFIDADLQNPPEAIPDLWASLMTGRSHIVQGVRSSIEWDRDARFLASRSLNWLLNVSFRDHAQDSKSGFIMGPSSALKDVLQYQKSYRYPQTFIRVAALARGYSVSEVETLFAPRRVGTSFLSTRRPLKVYADVLWDVLRARAEFRIGKRQTISGHFIPPISAFESLKDPQTAVSLGLKFYFSTMPAHAWLLRPGTRDLYEWLEVSQWATMDEIRSLQFRRAERLLWHAYLNVPYYRMVFDTAGFHPRRFNCLEDLLKIPLLSKKDVSSNLYMRMFATTHIKREMLKIATSGSTGEPFVTFADRNQLEFRFATTLRALEWTGWTFGDPQVRLWHQRLGMSPTQVIRERLDAQLMKRKFVPAFELDEARMAQMIKTLNDVRPALIDGYAESLNFLALYLKGGGSLEFTPKGVLSSAQMLTKQTRKEIEDSLGAKVHDKYGAREFSGIAYQCKESSYKHVMDESYIVEILKDGRPAEPGETGEVVITDLNNYSVPLIRYRIGDLAEAVNSNAICECGRGLSQIGDIQGRTQAIVHCANGRWLPGTFFAHFFKDYEHLVRLFQIVQHEKSSFELRVVQGPQWTPEQWASLMEHLREYVGPTEIQVDFVESVPLLATGKRTPVVSHIKVDFQQLT